MVFGWLFLIQWIQHIRCNSGFMPSHLSTFQEWTRNTVRLTQSHAMARDTQPQPQIHPQSSTWNLTMTDRWTGGFQLKDVLFSARFIWVGSSINLPRRTSSSLGSVYLRLLGFSNCLSFTNGTLRNDGYFPSSVSSSPFPSRAA